MIIKPFPFYIPVIPSGFLKLKSLPFNIPVIPLRLGMENYPCGALVRWQARRAEIILEKYPD